jgi:broad specificity phosphatase PhoE
MIRLLIVCSASTEAHRRAAFPIDEPLNERGVDEARARKLPRADFAAMSPALRTRQTAEHLNLAAEIDPLLREVDYGTWAGRTLKELEPDVLSSWLADPASTPHGGESIASLFDRVRKFLDGVADGTTIAVTHASFARAAVAIVLDAPMVSFWKVDVGPAALVTLTSDGRAWRLRSVSD